jgi:N-acetylmuramoyl-L-alanine amidase
MDVIRRGDHGEQVLDVQSRLTTLGYQIPDDERAGSFGPQTEQRVRDFQLARGLVVDGLVGEATWRELVEASFALGDRVLYLRAPHMRGDDVRELQDRLQTLGFDTGRTDGILGPQTAQAIREFQRNYGLPADGIVAAHTLRAMNGLARKAGDTPIGMLIEREQMRRRTTGISSMRIVVDPGHGGTDGGVVGAGGAREADRCFDLAQMIEPLLATAGAEVYLTRRADTSPSDTERAALANALDADVFLSIHLGCVEPERRGAAAFYFGHARFHSSSGAHLAALLAEHIAPGISGETSTQPKTFPLLRETQMTAVLVEPAHLGHDPEDRALLDPEFRQGLARAIVRALHAFARAAAPEG